MSKLTPKTIINAATKFENFKEWASVSDVRKALEEVESYMAMAFPLLKYAIHAINMSIADSSDTQDKFRIEILTDAEDENNYGSLWFYFLTKSKTLVPYFELHFVEALRTAIYPDYDHFINKNKIGSVYFAVYDEEDREDGNPHYQIIDYNDLNGIKFVEDLLKLSGEYQGDGCIEVRVKDKNGEEDAWLYFDNNGYEFLVGPEKE